MESKFTDSAQMHVSGVLSRRNPHAAIDITLLMTAIVTLISMCRRNSGTPEAAVQNMRRMPRPRQRALLRRQLIDEYGNLRNFRAAGGMQLVDDTLQSLDEAPNQLLTGFVAECSGDEQYLL